MKKLDEKLSLLRLAEGFGLTPDPKLLEEIAQLRAKEARKLKQQQELKERVQVASQDLFKTKSAEVTHQPQPKPATPEIIQEEVLITPEPKPETLVDRVARSIKETVVSQGEPALVPKPADPLVKKVELLEKWISRIAATGPGGGAAQIYNIDIPVKTVTGNYTIGRKDYYIGVSSTVKTYITLPTTGSNLKEGRIVVIKDESGHAQLTPIAIVGTIDNDPNGAEIRINNGAVQLVYRSGWRII